MNNYNEYQTWVHNWLNSSTTSVPRNNDYHSLWNWNIQVPASDAVAVMTIALNSIYVKEILDINQLLLLL